MAWGRLWGNVRVPMERAPGARAAFLAQLPLTGATALVVFAIAIFEPKLLGSAGFVFGTMLVFIITAFALVLPWGRLPPALVAVLPIADIVAIGFMHVSGDVIRLSMLLFLPTIWLASWFYALGAVIAFVLGAIVVWSPNVTQGHGLTIADFSRVSLVPAMLAILGATIAAMALRNAAQSEMLVRQGALIEEALERAKQQRRVLDGILNAVDFGIIGLDAAGQQSLVNRRGSSLLGLAPGEAVGNLELYDRDGDTRLADEDEPLTRAARGEAFQGALVWRRPQRGAPIALSVSARQIAAENGRRTGAVVVFSDVTAEVEALRGRDELVSAVTHELRTPLTSIVGYLELAEDEPGLPAMAASHIRVAEQNADRMLHLIADLLAAASAAAGKLEVHPRPLDLAPIVRDAIAGMLPRAHDRDITVECTLDDEAHVLVDDLRIRQVVDNVLSNAIKYGKVGGHVEVSAHDQDSRLVLVVRDDGIGIDDGDQERLFGRFFRASAVRGGEISGTGLGLSISQAIMREHGGDIRLTSTLGEGTTVSIVIPRAPRDAGEADASVSDLLRNEAVHAAVRDTTASET
ncbi:MAG TPA: ATP-binding protein [Humibacter sp.]|nr:ATP-binding protein [Humibacter sp.]